MRTALISDIHGNGDGLRAVLSDIERRSCDRILCLGDLVDGGPQSVAVVHLLRERAIPVVQGNHDEFPNESLPPEVLDFLDGLPESITEDDTIYTHTSPRPRRKRNISDPIEAWNVFEETHYRRVFVGDVHVPLIYGQCCAQRVSATAYDIPYDEPFPFAPDDRYIVCVGSVGYSRDASDRLRYAVFDDARDTVTFHAPDGPTLAF